MSSPGTWRCPDCRERLEDQFEECWNCGYVRGSGGDERVQAATDPADPLVCPTCKLDLDYLGKRRFYQGQGGPFPIAEIADALASREYYDLYACSRCGRVELFLSDVGKDLR